MHIKKGFTLAEILVTLMIIGVIASITIPNIMAKSEREANRAGLKKAISVLNQAAEKSYFEFSKYPNCYYWDKNPYGGATCKGYDKNGNCTGYTLNSTGGALPGNYNGNFGQCRELFAFFKENLNITKICETNGLANGCMPEYKGNDEVKKGGYGDDMSDEDKDIAANKATSGCNGYRGSALKTKQAIVTADGMIFFPYTANYASIIAVDVNGMKGPNKWGYDVFSLYAVGNIGKNLVYAPGGCEFVEKGGKTGKQMLYGK